MREMTIARLIHPFWEKKAMDVAESRNLIHGSDCNAESRIN
jgi:hypothetical protein